ncbi:Hypothetical predicted protein [Marmota monax]|uniref:C2 domain-containing protein n=1 Tax=Marmota monax TaxID=9995 RepID=A0A5E4BWI7_MARMO|nr:Hypothetical predicted protein [Marmota monax]
MGPASLNPFHLQEKADLGELNFSLCYLPTAGRLTVTIIKASNLKAMDLTGFSDPYVKASLISEGRRLKKRKTSIKKNTLNPTYNEALVFDVAPESVENVGLSIAVVDYDWSSLGPGSDQAPIPSCPDCELISSKP